MMDKRDFENILVQKFKKVSISLSEKQRQRFWLYLNFLQEENKKYNLTGITNSRKIITHHFLDSGVILSPESGPTINFASPLLDLGTGAGFPGLVIKILEPELKVYLVDSVLKKVNFIKLLLNKLQFKKKPAVIQERAERLGQDQDFREKFSIVTARALAPLNSLVEYCLPFVRVEGSFIAYKGPNFQQELQEAETAISLLGGELSYTKKVNIPGIEGERYIINIEKKETTPANYPRQVGVPEKRPL